jgi:hypothetical protein
MSKYATWNRPIVATPPQHCSAIAARVVFEEGEEIAVPEGAILLGAPHTEAVKLGAIAKRAFGTATTKTKSLLDMTPFYDQGFKGVQNKTVPLVAGVASDSIVPASRHKRDTVASAYIHGACNARCDPADSHNFVAGDLVYIVAKKDKSELYAGSEKKKGNFIAGVLGTCLENGERNSPFVRVFVDNTFNTMLSCC